MAPENVPSLQEEEGIGLFEKETHHGFSIWEPQVFNSNTTLKELLGASRTGRQVAQVLESYILKFVDGNYSCPHVSVNFRPTTNPDGLFDMNRSAKSLFREEGGLVHIRVYYQPNDSKIKSWKKGSSCGNFACVAQSPWLKQEALTRVYDSHSNVVIRLPFPPEKKWKSVSVADLLRFLDIEMSRSLQLLKVEVETGVSIICTPPPILDEGLRTQLSSRVGRSLDKDRVSMGLSNPVLYNGTRAIRYLLDKGDPTGGAFCKPVLLDHNPTIIRDALPEEEVPEFMELFMPGFSNLDQVQLRIVGLISNHDYCKNWYSNHYGYLVQSRGNGQKTLYQIDTACLYLLRYWLVTPKMCDHATCDCYK
jgi:hypothetical protein